MRRTFLPTFNASFPVARRVVARLMVSVGLVMLAACNGDAEEATLGEQTTGEADASRSIPCALDESPEFSAICTRTTIPGEEGSQLILEGPDGSFRRFMIVSDGRGLVAADGAIQPQIRILADDRIEVEIGGDRYRLPATVAGTAPPAAETGAEAPAEQ